MFALVSLAACSGQTATRTDGPPEEVLWRLAQESLLPGQRIENLTIVRIAECQLSANTKASFGYDAEWVVEYTTDISQQNGNRSSHNEETVVVALKENGQWIMVDV